MSPTNPVYDRFYRTAGPTLVRWAGLQQLLLGAEGAPLPDGLAEAPGAAPESSVSPPDWAQPGPGRARPAGWTGTRPVAIASQQAPAWQPPETTSPWTQQAAAGNAGAPRFDLAPSASVLAPPDRRPAAEPAQAGTPRLDLSPAAGARLPATRPLTSASALPGAGALPPTAEVAARTAASFQPAGAAVESPAPIAITSAPLAGAPSLAPAAAASPALGALLEAATRRSRRQELLLALAAAHLPTAPLTRPTTETRGDTEAPAAVAGGNAPSIRFTAPVEPDRPAAAPAASAPEEDFLYEERLRSTLEKILRTDALRHGLQLGER